MKKMKIEIMGSNSFLARNFIQYIFLNNLECELVLYDIAEKQIGLQSNFTPNIEYKQIDLEKKNDLEKISFNSDVFFIFTGKTGTVKGFEGYEEFIKVNEIYLLHLLTEYVKRNSKSKIIYPSTRLVYKENKQHKIKEDAEKKMKSIYAVNKYAAEKYIELFHETFGVEYCIFRICTPYGTLLEDAGNYGTFEFFTNQAKSGKDIRVFGSGDIRKTYTHINNICELFWKCIDCKECKNDVFNVGGVDKTLAEIAEEIARLYNVYVKYVPWPEINKKIDGGTTVLEFNKLDKIVSINYK